MVAMTELVLRIVAVVLLMNVVLDAWPVFFWRGEFPWLNWLGIVVKIAAAVACGGSANVLRSILSQPNEGDE